MGKNDEGQVEDVNQSEVTEASGSQSAEESPKPRARKRRKSASESKSTDSKSAETSAQSSSEPSPAQETLASMQQATEQLSWTNRVRRLLKECVVLLLATIALYLFISLVTFDAGDPGFNVLAHETMVHNDGGRVGALIADVLLTMVGYVAYSVPLTIVAVIIEMIWPRKRSYTAVIVLMQIIGIIVLVAASASLAELVLVTPFSPLPGAPGGSPGGLLGSALALKSNNMFNPTSARLLWAAALLIGLTLVFEISWLEVLSFAAHRLAPMFPFLGRVMSGATRKGVEKFRAHRREAQSSVNAEVVDVPRLAPTVPEQATASCGGAIIMASAATTRKEGDEGGRKKTRTRRRRIFNKLGSHDAPSIELLDPPDDQGPQGFSEQDLKQLSETLVAKLKDFGIEATVETVLPGPVITRFEIQPAPGIKVSRISNLAKDLARSLAVISVRVVEVIPGKTVVGIEIPNTVREVIRLREVVSSEVYEAAESALTLSLGKDIAGYPIVADLARMPHLLVAGTTGSGKSVGLNAMLISMLMKATPHELRLIMIDPKMLELSIYDDIPHLLSPVVTDMKEAANALRWCVAEMERRYKLMASLGVRNIAGYNRKVHEAIEKGEPIKDPLFKSMPTTAGVSLVKDGESAEPDLAPDLEMLPKIVVVVDEFADMMMIVGKKVEELIARIAQKARAAGIHLILATQRPSVDVITGLIKANVPTRIAFQVSSKVDSRTILDQGGAEQLLGHGDMLYLPPGTGLPMRVHGAFVSDEEVHRICDDWRARGEPDYLDEVRDGQLEEIPGTYMPGGYDQDGENSEPLYDEAVRFVTETRRASISSVQRKLKIGYNRAARMIEMMESAGVVSTMGTNGSREVLAPPPVELT